ncbi:GNAT family N-acetyltransferase [Acidisoma cellulosilytica]|uniref:GNAT family N-acetyltransferase n=1 Tax=Acidisoma cellulosilyticum TaxID=2802395 RepID=A0A964E4K9_9PROT|nr:GNAT family N-acetyltransferase [Acidisoma cellulosilyticum]MCB8881372.1 GNAT family N-acetyltransferase [Acidisoma cellulosilyticum]
MPDPAPNAIRRLVSLDVACFRELRLEGLKTCPQAFGAMWEDERAKPTEWFVERLERNIIFGALDAWQNLVGMAALFPSDAPKTRHKGIVWGVFVSPRARRAGLAAKLLDAVLTDAAQVVEEARLTVGTSNAGAIGLYRRAGFTQYGQEPRAVQLDGVYYDEYLMGLRLTDYNRPSGRRALSDPMPGAT